MGESVATADLDRWIRAFAQLVAENKDLLTELDAAIGDGDHGANMDRGLRAAVAAIEEAQPATASALFTKVGMTLVSTVGGASGPLFGTLFLRLGSALADVRCRCRRRCRCRDACRSSRRHCGLGWTEWSRGARPRPVDKTMFDALAPAVEALEAAASQQVATDDGVPTRAGCRRGRPRRDDADARAQGSRQLPGRAQRRAPGSRRDDGRSADGRGDAGAAVKLLGIRSP